MKYVIKKVEEYYYRIPIEREDEFDELADLDSQCNTYDLCKPNCVLNIFNKYLIEEEEFIVVEKDDIYYHIPELFEDVFKYYVKLSGDGNLNNELINLVLINLVKELKSLFDDFIISVE